MLRSSAFRPSLAASRLALVLMAWLPSVLVWAAPSERMTGIWRGNVVVNGLERTVVLQVQEREDGRLLGYILGSTGHETIVSGRTAKKQFELELEFRNPASNTVVLLSGRMQSKDRLEAEATVAGTVRPASFTRVEGRLHERRLLAAILPPAGGEPLALTDLSVLLDDAGALVSGAFVGQSDCTLWGCEGSIDSFIESGASPAISLSFRTPDACSAGSGAALVFDASTQLYFGSFTLNTCAGSTGRSDLAAARTTRTNSDDVTQLLARLGTLADDLESTAALTAPHPSISTSYLDRGTDLAGLLAFYNSEKTRYSSIEAVFNRIALVNTVADPETIPALQVAQGAVFQEIRRGVPVGGTAPVTYVDSLARPGRNLLRVWANTPSGWVVRGDGLPGMDFPFAYSVSDTGLEVPVNGGTSSVWTSIGPYGAHFGPLTGHAYGDGKGNLVGFFTRDDGDLTLLPNGVRAFYGGAGGSGLLARRPLYRAPRAATLIGLECMAAPAGNQYLLGQSQWNLRLAFGTTEDMQIGHLGQIYPDLRQLVIGATAGSVDTDAIVCPAGGTGNLLAGVTIPLEAHTSLGWPQVLAVPVAGYPDYFTGGGTVSDRPWAQMEFFFAAKTDATPDEISNACVYDFMNLGRKLELQAAMERNMADPLSQLFRARQDPLFKWRWGAEARLCMAPTSAPSDFSDLYTRLGGWFERPSTAPSSPDEIVGFAPIAKDVATYDATRYYAPTVDMLIARRRNIAQWFLWRLPGAAVSTRIHYPDGEIVERTQDALLIRWRDLNAGIPGEVYVAELWQRASYSLDVQGLKIHWGQFASSPAAALPPAPASGMTCDGSTVVCYDHTSRPGF